MSVFEYILSSKFIDVQTGIVISFDVTSSTIEEMNTHQFKSKIVFKQKQLISYIAQELEVHNDHVELLQPTKTHCGARYTFIVAADQSEKEQMNAAMVKASTETEHLKKVSC